jgi:endonuclease III
LEAAYGTPDLGNKENPLDEVVFIVLSQMTTGPSYGRVFDRLKAAVSSWDDISTMPLRRLRSIIKDAGLSGQKAPRLKAIIKKIRAAFGAATLDPLRKWDDARVERFLTSLPGVGVKTAKCIMMYSLGRQVLPVDTHVRRVLTRLGLLPDRLSHHLVHTAAERVIPAGCRYSMHVNGVAHGRRTCLAVSPRCDNCCVKRFCAYVLGRGASAQSPWRKAVPRSCRDQGTRSSCPGRCRLPIPKVDRGHRVQESPAAATPKGVY